LERIIKQTAKGAGITLLGDILGKVIYLISQIVVARLLGAKAFGIYALSLAIFNIVQTLSRMGLSQGVLRYVSIYNGIGDKAKVKGTIIEATLTSLLLGVTLGAATFFCANILAKILGKPILIDTVRIVSFGIPFMASMMVALEATRGFRKMEYFVYVKNIIHPMVNLTAIILLYWLGLRLLGALAAWVLSAIVGFIFALYFIKRELPEFFRIKACFNLIELLKFSTPLAFVGILQMLFMRTDIFMLGYFRSSTEVGIYNAATQIVIILIMLLMAFNAIFAPIAAHLHNSGKIHELNDLFKVTSKWIFISTAPIFIVIIIFAKDILNIFGTKFIEGVPALIMLATFNFISISIGPVTQVLIMSGKQRVELYNSIFGFILNVVLNFLFIPNWGIKGAALATGVSILVIHLMRLIQVRSLLCLWPFSKKHLKGVTAMMVATFVAILYRRFLALGFGYPYSLLTTVAIVGTIFVGILLLLRLDEEDQIILNALRKRR